MSLDSMLSNTTEKRAYTVPLEDLELQAFRSAVRAIVVPLPESQATKGTSGVIVALRKSIAFAVDSSSVAATRLMSALPSLSELRSLPFEAVKSMLRMGKGKKKGGDRSASVGSASSLPAQHGSHRGQPQQEHRRGSSAGAAPAGGGPGAAGDGGAPAKDEKALLVDRLLLQFLIDAFEVPEEQAMMVIHEAEIFGTEWLVRLLEQRRAQIDAHPGFLREDFEAPAAFARWRSHELQKIEEILALMEQHQVRNPNLCGSMEVSVYRARGLKGKDRSGFSDPYCTLSFPGSDDQSGTVVDQCLDPEWNDKFVFDVYGAGELTVMVWDKDTIGRDQFLGKLDLKCPILPSGYHLPRGWHTLQKRSWRSHISGDIEVEVVIVPFYPPRATDRLPPFDTMFGIIARRLSALDRRAGVVASSPNTLLVLHEVGTRWGLSRLHRTLKTLDELAGRLRGPDLAALQEAHSGVLACEELDPLASGTVEERALHVTVCGKVARAVDGWLLAGHQALFPAAQRDTPRRLALCLDLQRRLYVHLPDRHASYGHYLVHALESAVRLQYAALRKPWFDEAERDAVGPRACALLAELVGESTEAIEADRNLYSRIFPEELELASVTGRVWVSLTLADLRHYLEGCASAGAVPEDCFSIMAKTRELLALEAEVEGGESGSGVAEEKRLASLFGAFMKSWVSLTGARLHDWAARALDADAMAPLNEDSATGRHSTSVVDVLQAILQAAEFFGALEWPAEGDPSRSALARGLLQSLLTVATGYASRVLARLQGSVRRSLDESKSKQGGKGLLGKLKRKIKGSSLEPTDYFHIDQEDCVTLNNLETLADSLGSLRDSLCACAGPEAEASLGELVETSASGVRRTQEAASECLMGACQPFLAVWVARAVDKNKDHAPLLEYLDTQLAVLRDHLYDRAFRSMLRVAWNKACEALEEKVLKAGLTDANLAAVDSLLVDLSGFFHAGGAGLPQTYVDRRTGILRQQFSLLRLPADRLMAMTRDLFRCNPTSAGLNYTHILRILEAKKDKKVALFCKEFKAAALVQARWRGARSRAKEYKHVIMTPKK